MLIIKLAERQIKFIRGKMMGIIVNFTEESEKLNKLYKEFEETIRNKSRNIGIYVEGLTMEELIKKLALKNSVVKRYKNEIDTIRRVRNLNTHQRNDKYEYVVCPNPDMNIKFRKIIDEINNPPTIYNSNMCIKRNYMYCKNLNDDINSTIKDMIEKVYTHIPIIENNILKGVFSESTLLDIINKDKGIIIDKSTQFKEIEEFLKIENHTSEEFIFISKNKNIYDIEEMFKNYFSKKKKIGCIYITENGKSTERILGMTTAWDILGH